MRPHLGEFDQEALFSSELNYERAVFKFLRYRSASYRVVLEIGANVGVYTVFFSRVLAQHPVGVFAFEPSREAFRRLTQNLADNACENVDAFRLAVSGESGFVPFFEPRGHLTNGSFSRAFAEFFSPDVRERRVPALPAVALEALLALGPALLKIDVEGAEPAVVCAFLPMLEKYSPDLLIEVLHLTECPLASLRWPSGYEFFEICDEGVVRRDFPRATKNRDYFITRRAKEHGLT